jgi:hypothetical protein
MSGNATTTVADELHDPVTDDTAKVGGAAARNTSADLPVDQTPNALAVSAKSSALINGVLMIAISVISGAIGAVIYERMQPPPPRILVLDMGALLKPIAEDPSLNALEKRRITEDIGVSLDKAMQQEAETGAIILDASVVLKAPGDSYVQP